MTTIQGNTVFNHYLLFEFVFTILIKILIFESYQGLAEWMIVM